MAAYHWLVRVPWILAKSRIKTVFYHIKSRVPVSGSRNDYHLLLCEGLTARDLRLPHITATLNNQTTSTWLSSSSSRLFQAVWPIRKIHTLWVITDQRNSPFISWQLCQMFADFQNSFTFGFSKKFAIKHLSCFPPHRNYVATPFLWNLNATFIILSLQLLQQEAPLTLRGQRGRCGNIKGEPQIFGSFPSPKRHPFFLWVWFYDGPWQTQAVY